MTCAFVAALPKTALFLGAGLFAAKKLQDSAVKNHEIKKLKNHTLR